MAGRGGRDRRGLAREALVGGCAACAGGLTAVTKFLIYGLVDPRTKLVRYVGKSSSGLTRPRSHLCPSNLAHRTYSARWIKSLLALGLRYEIVVLETPHKEILSDTERWWIAYGRASGWPLTNLTDGGEGAFGTHPVFTPHHRASLSVAARRRDPATRRGPKTVTAKVKASRVEVWARDGQRQRRSELLTRLWQDPEYTSRLSVAHIGKRHTEEHKAKIRANAKRGDDNPAKDPAVRARISAGLREAWQRRRERAA